MTETTCPTCGAKCCKTEESSCGRKICSVPEHHVKALPQPDLTKLRVFHDLIVNDDIDVAIMDFSGSENIQELWHAIKEVLDAETSNSEN